MKLDLLIRNAAEIETECLVVTAVDKGDKEKSLGSLLSTEKAIQDSAS
jgi:hypothetical protein